MGSNRRTQKKTNALREDEQRRSHKWSCYRERNRSSLASASCNTTAGALCVHMPFLPRFSYFVNCFRTHRPPTRVWETVSRAQWASPADAAYDPLFAHMPDLWDLRAKHQTIWANPKQTQTTQWPHVPYKRMARKLTTNHLLQYWHWLSLVAAAYWLLPTGCGTAGWLLAAALLPLLFLLLLANACETPLGSKTAHGPKRRTESKIYVFRGRNVPSEILQKYLIHTLFHRLSTLSTVLTAVKSCWLLLADC